MKIHSADALIYLSDTEGKAQKRTMSSWFWANTKDGGMAYPVDISVLYRGQNKRHLPMLPSIARGLSHVSRDMASWLIKDQSVIIIRLAQAKWFVTQLEFHPLTLDNHKNIVNVKEARWPLAQHYGIPTDYLDLSDSFDVSAFFATCYEKDGIWRPVESGTGVMYRIEISKIDNEYGRIFPLGPQYLPRPAEQSGWVYEVADTFSHSFDGDTAVRVMEFEHNKVVGEHFLDKFDGGRKLFPPDPLAEVAHDIITCNEIPIELIEWAFDACRQQPFGPRAEQASTIKREINKTHSFCPNRKILGDDIISRYTGNREWLDKYGMPVRARVIGVKD